MEASLGYRHPSPHIFLRWSVSLCRSSWSGNHGDPPALAAAAACASNPCPARPADVNRQSVHFLPSQGHGDVLLPPPESGKGEWEGTP